MPKSMRTIEYRKAQVLALKQLLHEMREALLEEMKRTGLDDYRLAKTVEGAPRQAFRRLATNTGAVCGGRGLASIAQVTGKNELAIKISQVAENINSVDKGLATKSIQEIEVYFGLLATAEELDRHKLSTGITGRQLLAVTIGNNEVERFFDLIKNSISSDPKDQGLKDHLSQELSSPGLDERIKSEILKASAKFEELNRKFLELLSQVPGYISDKARRLGISESSISEARQGRLSQRTLVDLISTTEKCLSSGFKIDTSPETKPPKSKDDKRPGQLTDLTDLQDILEHTVRNFVTSKEVLSESEMEIIEYQLVKSTLMIRYLASIRLGEKERTRLLKHFEPVIGDLMLACKLLETENPGPVSDWIAAQRELFRAPGKKK